MTSQSMRSVWLACAIVAALLHLSAALADTPSHDAFTYQGQLTHNGAPVAGPVDLKFRLYNAATDGDQIGLELIADDFADFDDEGRFTIDLAFGKGVFDGTQLWLEIQVNETTLSPRQPITPTPYSVRSLNVAHVSDSALAGTYSNPLDFTNVGNAFAGAFTGSFSGGGVGLTNLNAGALAFGSVPGGRLAGTYPNALTFSNASNSFTGSFSGNGAGLSNLNAGSVTTGNLSVARMPTGGAWALSSTLRIETNNNTLVVGFGRVGMRTASPAGTLHVVIPDNAFGVLIDNSLTPPGTWRGGIRLTDNRFLDVTNNALSGAPNMARLDSTGNWTAVSDRRVKRDVRSRTGLLEAALGLRPVCFRFHEPAGAGDAEHIGFVAQEVEDVLPAFVTSNGEDVRTLNYAGLSTVAIGAIQELKREKDAEIQSLSDEVAQLRELVHELMAKQKGNMR